MTCVAGVCGGGGGGGCDASTCANGCCDGTTCIAIADQSTAACGTNGHACVVCANGAACVAGVCAANLIPTGQACVAGVDTCEDPTAQCIQYGSGPEEFGAPTGTFCLWPDAAPCSPPGIQATFCAEGYCAPNGSDPAFCGTLTYTSECTSNTDSGAGSVVWSPAQFAACGVSPDDYKEVYMGPGSATTTCTSLADCVSSNPSNVVCIDNTSASSLFTIGGMAIGGYCASGFYQCMTANDCPPLQGYTANCSPIGSLMGCGYIP